MSSPLDRFRLDGRTVAITGASSGFGHHFAGVLAAAGARVVLGARRVEKIAERVEEIRAAGGEALGVVLDVCESSSLAEFFDSAWAAYGGVDVLIQNAGVEAGAKTYMMIDEEDWDRVLDTNLKSVWLGAKLYTERVVAGDQATGNIVNIGSITSYRHIKGQFPYAVSKAGLTKATEILALEGARYGIRVNTLAPGYILTDVSRVLLEGPGSEEFARGIPQRRYGEFDDLDGPLLLLASDASSYMTGSTIVVDGGHLCAAL
jgi:NAD(P)-dependent dehydrogenase (short-subunit alcohol dehydrogenase family)